MADGPDIGIGSSTATPPPAPPDSSASSTPPTAPPDSSANPPAPPSDAMIRARAGTPGAETQAWQTAQGIAPTSQAAAPVVLQPLKRHGLAGVMDEVGKFLTGTQGGEVYIDQDGKKYIQHPPQTHAQQWARVGLEALQGGARGLAAGQGPGGKGRALLASVQGGINDRQQADALKDEEATKSWQMQRQAKIDKATMQIQQMKIAEMALAHDRQGFELSADKKKFADEQQDRYRAMGGHAIPGYYSSEDFHEIKKVAPNVWNDHFEKANIMPVHTAQGVQFWEIPPDRMDAPLPAHTKGRLWVPDDSKEGGHTETPEFPEGSVERDLEMMNNKWTLDSGAALERRTKAAQATTEEAKAGHAEEMAGLDVKEKKAGIYEKQTSATKNLAEAAAANTKAKGGAALPTRVDGTVDFTQLSPQQISVGSALQRGDAAMMDLVGRASPEQRQQLFALAQAFDPTFNVETYQEKLKTSKAWAAGGEEAESAASFNQLIRHLGNVSDGVQKMRNPTDMPFLNQPLNKLRTGMGSTAVTNTQFPIMAARNEAFNFLKGQHALHKNDIDDAQAALNSAQTPAMIQGAVKSMMKTVAERLDEKNNEYFRVYHRNAPALISPETAQVLRANGQGAFVDKWSQKTAADIPFSVSKYRAGNPNGDLNKDLRDAAAAGHPIIQ